MPYTLIYNHIAETGHKPSSVIQTAYRGQMSLRCFFLLAVWIATNSSSSLAGSTSNPKIIEEFGDALSKTTTTLEALLLANNATCDPASSAASKINGEYARFKSYVAAVETYFANSGVATNTSLIGNFRLSVADKAVKVGCLDIADAQYRQVMSIYSGIAYTALRDQAKIGIEDVRDARRRQERANQRIDGPQKSAPPTEKSSGSSLDKLEADTYRGFDRPK